MKLLAGTGWIPKQRKWQIIFSALCAVSLIWLLATFAFILDVKEKRFISNNEFGTSHNCLTAYAAASHFASQKTEDLYNAWHYRDPIPYNSPVHEAVFGIFRIDQYMYAPQFLILPYAIWSIVRDFFGMRIVWFLLTAVLFIAALALTAKWCGAFRNTPRLLLFPMLLCAPTVHITLQIGNVHLMIIAVSLLSMLAIEKKHPVLGGALLAYAALAKLWPAVLVLYILVQRRWKAVISIGVAALIYTGVGMLLFGLASYKDFFERMLPQLLNGEAFNWMIYTPAALAENMSIFSLWHKLYGLHVLSAKPPLILPAVSWTMMGIIVLTTVITALNSSNKTNDDDAWRLRQACVWLLLITLMQLRSPFLPWHYGVISTLCLLLFAAASAKGWQQGLLGGLWCVLAVHMPIAFLLKERDYNLHYTFIASILMYAALLAIAAPDFFTFMKSIWDKKKTDAQPVRTSN